MVNLYWLLGMIVMLTLYPAVTWRVGIGMHQVLRIDLPLFLLFPSGFALVLVKDIRESFLSAKWRINV